MNMSTEPLELQLRHDARAWQQSPSTQLHAAIQAEVASIELPPVRRGIFAPTTLFLAVAAGLLLLMGSGIVATQLQKSTSTAAVEGAHMPVASYMPAEKLRMPVFLPPTGPTVGLASVAVGMNQQVEELPETMSSFAEATYAGEWNALKADMLALTDSLTAPVPPSLLKNL